jgi:uncharacterized protein YcbX
MARIESLYRYPVKGLSPELLESAEVEKGGCFPFDRAFALAHASTQFDPNAPKHLRKNHFLQLMRNERLAKLRTAFDPETKTLVVSRDGKVVAKGNLGVSVGRQLIEQFFAAWMGDEVRGAPRVVQAANHSFSDFPAKVVSLINLASVRDLQRVVGRPVDPLRFRGNVYLEDVAPWNEFDWLGKELRIGAVRLLVTERIKRCPATNVDPLTGERDLNLPATLQDSYQHMDLGVYATVVQGGQLAAGAALEIEGA